MDVIALNPLNALESSLSTLLTSLTTTPTFANAPAATNALLTADDALTSALITLKQHQQNYAKILSLRAEATRLEDQIKSIVRTCGELRNEVGAIHPSILDDSSDDDEDEDEDEDSGARKQRDVDYYTLLSFARRIGKHNTEAAREAEEDAIRRQQEAKERGTATTQILANGNIPAPAAESTGNIIPENEQAWLDETAAAARAVLGMAFPPAERLRLGMLGQLQLIREQGGEEAVEREVEKLMGIRPEDQAEGSDKPMESIVSVEASGEAQSQSQAQTQVPPRSARPQPPPPERKKSQAPLSLDLWDDDDDD